MSIDDPAVQTLLNLIRCMCMKVDGLAARIEELLEDITNGEP